MANYLKPQTPIELGNNYIYPLTTADQVIIGNGNRLNSLFRKHIKESYTLLSNNWSDTLPYTQTINTIVSTDDYNVDANIMYSGNGEEDIILNKAASYITYVKKKHKEITFYCLKNKPEIDIPIELNCTCRNTIATIEEGVKLNFDIKRYSSEEEMLADTPKENTIGVITDVYITGYKFSVTEPEDMNDGEVWIKTGADSNAAFDIVDDVTVHPLNVKQMVSSTLVDVTAKSYQDGKWVDWATYLYSKGNEYTDITGGWALSTNCPNTSHGDSLTKNSESMVFSTSYVLNVHNAYGFLRANKKIDLTNKTTIAANLNSASINVPIYLCVKQNDIAVKEMIISSQIKSGDTKIQLDVTNLNGEYYVGFGADVGYGESSVEIQQVIVS